MKQIIDKLKAQLSADGYDVNEVVSLLKQLREYFKSNLKEPGLVKMIRLAYEDIEANGEYTFLYLPDDGSRENLSYFVDLLADFNNKYNREELQELRNLMEGIEPEEEEEEEDAE